MWGLWGLRRSETNWTRNPFPVPVHCPRAHEHWTSNCCTFSINTCSRPLSLSSSSWLFVSSVQHFVKSEQIYEHTPDVCDSLFYTLKKSFTCQFATTFIIWLFYYFNFKTTDTKTEKHLSLYFVSFPFGNCFSTLWLELELSILLMA